MKKELLTALLLLFFFTGFAAKGEVQLVADNQVDHNVRAITLKISETDNSVSDEQASTHSLSGTVSIAMDFLKNSDVFKISDLNYDKATGTIFFVANNSLDLNLLITSVNQKIKEESK